jgi:hypothetical protein
MFSITGSHGRAHHRMREVPARRSLRA